MKGYIINNAGDTIKGEIDNKNWDTNPTQVKFRKEGATILTTYKPLEIKAFAVANDIYVSKIVAIDRSPTEIDQMTTSPDPIMETDTIFLNAYLLGKANLYSFNQGRKQHFFIEKDTVIQELIHNQYRKMIGAELMIVESDHYKQQLIMNMGDCENMVASIVNLKFDESSFIKLVNQYNLCAHSLSHYVKKNEKIKFEYIVLAGISRTDFAFNSITNFVPVSHSTPSIDFTGGIGLNITSPRNPNHWSFYNDLFYSHYRYTASFENKKDPNNQVEYDYAFQFSYLKLANMLRYQYPGKNIKPFIGLGITNGYAIKYKGFKTVKEQFYGASREYTVSIVEDYKKHEIGVVANLGFIYKKILLEFRYEKNDGPVKDKIGLVNVTNYCFLLGYKF
jgi:hypothetical protein